MLVIAPRRVCQLVWWQESREWLQFKHLRFAWLHDSRAPWDMDGRPRKKEVEIARDDADVYLINPEGVAWLHKKFAKTRMPFEVVVVDELTKFKNHSAQRSKMLRFLTAKTPRLWGLTGSPTPNGYEDLFGQMLLLDGGNALGRAYTHFRDKYFVPDGFTGFDYKLAEGADKRIEERIAPLVLRISAEDWLDLPEKVDDPIYIDLAPEARVSYDRLKKDMLLKTPGGTVTAANSAALYSKLSQLANGAVYVEPEPGQPRSVIAIHDAKLEALDDLVDELAGAPLLLAYEFNHDLDRLKAWHLSRFKTPLRYLGQGVTDREVSGIERDWNNNAIVVLAAHPASAGHGLNFQKGGAQHVCWFSVTWDFELYDQFLRRVLRQGNSAPHVINHLLLVKNSIDELKYGAIADKDTTQARFLQALNTAFNDSPAAGEPAVSEKETISMTGFAKLARKGEATAPAAAPAQQAAAPAVAKPKGWGKPAAEPAPAQDAETTQRAAIQSKLSGAATRAAVIAEPVEDTETADVMAALPAEVKALMSGEETEQSTSQEAKPAARAKRAAAKKEDEVVQSVFYNSPRRTFSLKVGVSYDKDDNPVPSVEATFGVEGDISEEEATHLGIIGAAAVRAAHDRIVAE